MSQITPGLLPDPPTPPDADLRAFPYMPLLVQRIRDSALVAKASGEEFMAWMLLLCAAWHQVPAGSLPDDDDELATLAGYARWKEGWLDLGPMKLHGWKRHSDGRLYNAVLSEVVLSSLESQKLNKNRTLAATEARARKRDVERDVERDVDVTVSTRRTSRSPTEENRIEKKNPPKAPRKRVAVVSRPEGLPEEITDEHWRDFEEMRRLNRKYLTDRARKKLASKLTRFKAQGYDVKDLLDRSITNAWQDVYEPKDKKGNPEPPAKPRTYFQAEELPERDPFEEAKAREILGEFLTKGPRRMNGDAVDVAERRRELAEQAQQLKEGKQ